ncbi:MAG: hypothetical protein II192_08195, partial [Clostridia bacterium]|nr:hypothetical protein [Clostridia bacterium]
GGGTADLLYRNDGDRAQYGDPALITGFRPFCEGGYRILRSFLSAKKFIFGETAQKNKKKRELSTYFVTCQKPPFRVKIKT